jgi:5-(carboxyamino)imidazole ribonucleotide synthase
MNADAWFASSGKLGILGGGQLGKMLLEEAIRLDIEPAVMDPDPQCACSGITLKFEQGGLLDKEAILAFGRKCEVLTIEIENLDATALKQLEDEGLKVYPPSAVLARIQDKGTQKLFYTENDLPTAPYELFDSRDEVRAAVEEEKWTLPFVWKARRGGYDGRGVQIVKRLSDLDALPDVPCFLEDLVSIKTEIACVGVRSSNGEVAVYPPVEMEFHPETNQVEQTFVPSLADPELIKEAEKYTHALLEQQEHVGLLAVEFLVDEQGALLLNEMAPRPHNSGHIFSDTSWTSQFEQHLRAVMGFPLGETELRQPGVMINLVGDPEHEGPVAYEGVAQAMSEPGVYLHLYGKKTTRPNRKMGHVNIVAHSLVEARSRARNLAENIKIKSQ